jgi:hypothetical protein
MWLGGLAGLALYREAYLPLYREWGRVLDLGADFKDNFHNTEYSCLSGPSSPASALVIIERCASPGSTFYELGSGNGEC